MRPRVRSVPDYSFSSGVEAIELAESVGLVPDQHQRDAVMDILAENDAGKWSTFESCVVEPRQNGKGGILEIVDLADLFLFSSAQRDFLSIHTAHEFKTAQEAFRRVLFWVENTDWLRKKVARVRTSHGEEGLELLSGARLRFLARSGGSGRGFSADRLVYDEAYDLPEQTVAASLPIMSARPNPSVIYTSSAPLADAKGAMLRRVMRRGRREADTPDGERPPMDPNLAYIEYSADPKADLDDPDVWASANPGVAAGRLSLEFIAKERAAMSEVSFARERLGILDESSGATVIPMDLWDDLGDEQSTPLDPVSFAVDVAPDQSFSTIAIAGERADGLVHLEIVERRRGTGWVADRLKDLQEKWSPASIVLDPIGQSAALLPALDEAGVAYDLFATKDVTAACAYWFSLVTERRVRHMPQSGLRSALEVARKRKVREDGWAWHRRDSTDITPLVAVTNAAYAHALRSGRPTESSDSRMFFFSR